MMPRPNNGDQAAAPPAVSRPRTRASINISAAEEEHTVNKRSSWLITQREQPLPEIPAHFLDDYNHAARPKLEQSPPSQPVSEAGPPARKGSRPASSRSVSSLRVRASPTSATSLRPALRDNHHSSADPDVASKDSRHGIATERAAHPTSASSPRARRSLSSVSTAIAQSHARKLSKDAATLAALTGNRATMAHQDITTAANDDDLFLQLADDGTQRVPTRSSWHGKRRSHADTLPSPPDDRRPRTSGQIAGRPSSLSLIHI